MVTVPLSSMGYWMLLISEIILVSDSFIVIVWIWDGSLWELLLCLLGAVQTKQDPLLFKEAALPPQSTQPFQIQKQHIVLSMSVRILFKRKLKEQTASFLANSRTSLNLLNIATDTTYAPGFIS